MPHEKVVVKNSFNSLSDDTYHLEKLISKTVKDSHVNSAMTNAQIAELKKEVDALKKLQHPRLVKFIGASLTPPNFVIVTQFMPNGSLNDFLHIRKQVLSRSQQYKLSAEICEGVPENLINSLKKLKFDSASQSNLKCNFKKFDRLV